MLPFRRKRRFGTASGGSLEMARLRGPETLGRPSEPDPDNAGEGIEMLKTYYLTARLKAGGSLFCWGRKEHGYGG